MTAHSTLIAAARQLFLDRPMPAGAADVDPDELLRLATAHRALPMLFLAAQDPRTPEALRGPWRRQGQADYLRNTSNHALRARHALDLAASLNEAGVPCVCYRGPFSGLALYGDFATRPFQDVDLVVPDAACDRAWDIAHERGFHLTEPHMPRGFFRRHHVHWTFVKGPLLVDLHWAVEHPYTLYRIDYDEIFARVEPVEVQGRRWLQPCAEHRLLLACLQLTKHEPRAFDLAHAPDAAAHLFRESLFWKWLDIALHLHRDGPALDADRLADTARRWGAAESLAAGLAGASTLFGVEAPPALAADPARAAAPYRPAAAGVGNRVGRGIFALGGFRPGRIVDALRFLAPPAGYFAPARGLRLAGARLAHFVRGLGRVAVAGYDLLVTLPLAALRRRRHDLKQHRSHRMIARSSSL